MKQPTGILLSLAMALCLIPGVSMPAYAADTEAYADYDVTTDANKTKSGEALDALQVSFNEKKWYIIEDNSTAADAGTVTLLAVEPIGASIFNGSDNLYSTSEVRTYLDDQTKAGGAFADVADAIVTIPSLISENTDDVYDIAENVKLYLLSAGEANAIANADIRKCGKAKGAAENYWWLRTPGNPDLAAVVYGETGSVYEEGYNVDEDLSVRPALQLDLSSVTFSPESKTFSLEAVDPSVPLINSIELASASLTYTGKEQSPTVTRVLAKTAAGDIEVPAEAYTVTCIKHTDVGTYKVSVEARKDSGYRGSAEAVWSIKKGATSFKVSAKDISLKKVSSKAQKTTIEVTGLTEGSAKPTYKIKSVTKKMQKYVQVNKEGEVTVRKGCRKCTIRILVSSKATVNRSAAEKVVSIKVK